MLSTFRACAMAAALALSSLVAAAAPTPAPQPTAPVTASLLFDPPLGKAMRYRYEKVSENDGRKRSQWSVNTYVFEEREGGYRLTISPVSSSFEALAGRLPPKVQASMKQPLVLLLDEEAQIVGVENEEAVWEGVIEFLAALMATAPGAGPQDQAAVQGVAQMMRGLPAEARLASLSEVAAPLVEFANTQTTVGAPLVSEIEQESPFGTVKKQVTVALDKVEGGVAFISVKSSLPRAEMDRLMAVVAKQSLELVKPEGSKPLPSQEEMVAGMTTAFEHFSHDGAAIFEVSEETGLLRRYRSTDTMEMRDKNQTTRASTTISLERID